MQVGSLVRHIEYEYIGVALQQGVSTCDLWHIYWSHGHRGEEWYTECELEVLCK